MTNQAARVRQPRQPRLRTHQDEKKGRFFSAGGFTPLRKGVNPRDRLGVVALMTS